MADKEKNVPSEEEGQVNEEQFDTAMDKFFFHQRRALEETGKALEALLPPDFRSHAGEASKEFAKGFRVLVDAAIDELKKVSEREEVAAAAKPKNEEKKEKDDDEDENRPTTGKTKVKVKLD
jgi:hypothetical protein